MSKENNLTQIPRLQQLKNNSLVRKERLFQYLDGHREELKYARNGYKQPLLSGFVEASGFQLTPSMFDKLLSEFRRDYDCPIHYCSNKYYKRRPIVDGKTKGGYMHSYTNQK